MNDAITVLGHAFLGKPAKLDCPDAADEGIVGMNSAIYSLRFQFLGSAAPPAPYPACGTDDSSDSLGCDSSFCADDPTGEEPEGLLITSVEPREVDQREAPVTLHLFGNGFQEGDFVRLYYPTEDDLVMDVEPREVSAEAIEIDLDVEWFKLLENMSEERDEESPSGAERGPDNFFLKVVQDRESSANPVVVGVKRFAFRVAQIWTGGPLVAGEGDQRLGVDLEWRTWRNPVEVRVRGFEALPENRNTEKPTRYSLPYVPGIQADPATVSSGEEWMSIPVHIGDEVAPGRYLLHLTVAEKSEDEEATGSVLVSRTHEIEVVAADSPFTKRLKDQKPPPGDSPSVPTDPWILPGPPKTTIDFHIHEQNSETVTFR